MDFTIDDFKDHHNGNVFEDPKIKFSEKQVEEFFSAYEEKASSDNFFHCRQNLRNLIKSINCL